jgi:hypothetical protein
MLIVGLALAEDAKYQRAAVLNEPWLLNLEYGAGRSLDILRIKRDALETRSLYRATDSFRCAIEISTEILILLY